MSEQRPIDIIVGTPEWNALPKQEKKARLATVYDRGLTNVRLDTSFLPDDLHGEWVPKEQDELIRKISLGFQVYDGPMPTLHGSGDSSKQVADVILMTCPREHYDLLNEVVTEKYQREHGIKPAQQEEQQFASQLNPLRDAGIRPIVESDAKSVGKSELEEALFKKG